MNEQTEKLLVQVSKNLGTTPENLLSTLLKQATIYSTVTLLQTLFLLLLGLILWRIHKKLMYKPKGQEYFDNYYELYGEGSVIIMVCFFLAWCITTIIYFTYFNSVVNGFLNPEYWVIKELINLSNNVL